MKIKPNLAISETGFIFDPNSGETYSMNPVGTEMVDLIRNGTPIDDIKAYFVNKYQVDGSTVEKDIFDFVNILKQYQLINQNDEN